MNDQGFPDAQLDQDFGHFSEQGTVKNSDHLGIGLGWVAERPEDVEYRPDAHFPAYRGRMIHRRMELRREKEGESDPVESQTQGLREEPGD